MNTSPLNKTIETQSNSYIVTQNVRQSFRARTIGILSRIGAFFRRSETAGRAAGVATPIFEQRSNTSQILRSRVSSTFPEEQRISTLNLFAETGGSQNEQSHQSTATDKQTYKELSNLHKLIVYSGDAEAFRDASQKLDEIVGVPSNLSEAAAPRQLRRNLEKLKEKSPEVHAQLIDLARELSSLNDIGTIKDGEKEQIEKKANLLLRCNEPQ